MLFCHSTRVYFWGALTEEQKGLMFDPELLYTGANPIDVLTHDIARQELESVTPAAWHQCSGSKMPEADEWPGEYDQALRFKV